jgi:hypothetical protein
MDKLPEYWPLHKNKPAEQEDKIAGLGTLNLEAFQSLENPVALVTDIPREQQFALIKHIRTTLGDKAATRLSREYELANLEVKALEFNRRTDEIVSKVKGIISRFFGRR